MNTKFNQDCDEDEDDNTSYRKKKVQYYKRATPSFELVVNLNDDIFGPDHYFELLEEMESLSEGDVVDFKVSSCGGRLDGLVCLINGIRECEAPVIGTLNGEAASAATVLLLSCDGIRVKPYSTMMIHSASFGYVNHQSNMVSQATFVDKQARKILTDAYKDFLSDDELNSVFAGLELRLDYDQIVERLEQRDAVRRKRAQAEMDADEEVQEELVKPPRKKKVQTE